MSAENNQTLKVYANHADYYEPEKAPRGGRFFRVSILIAKSRY